MGTVEGSALSVAVCVSGRVSGLCVLCLSDTYSVLLLVDRANRKAAAVTLSLGWRCHHHPAPWAHLTGQEEFLGPEEVPTPHVTSLKFLFLQRGDLLLLLLC